MITVTDGSSLDMPFHLKFPKIAARLQEFVTQSTEKELVFPTELSAGERSAAHSLAGGEGLGHQTQGEDSNRTIRVWKPETEEEAAAIKEEEKKRVEEQLKTVKDRSKNGERSLSVPYSREDMASTKPQQKPQETGEAAVDGTAKGAQEGAAGGESDKGDKVGPKRTGKSKLTQDFRTERGYAATAAAAAAAAQRGDLVMFDVILNRGTMKRRATNVKVTKRAADQIKPANGNVGDVNGVAVGGGGVGGGVGMNARGGVGGGGGGQPDNECMGVVSLVQLERHFGFIDMLDVDERVFFHLSEVITEEGGGGGTGGGADARNKEGGAPDSSAGGGDAGTGGGGGGGGGDGIKGGRVLIKKGQEVAFRLGQRQGRPLGLRVRKLKPGTLPTEESLPSRFVGVVVVAPRNVGGADNEKDAMASAAGMEGVLVMLHDKEGAAKGKAASSEGNDLPEAAAGKAAAAAAAAAAVEKEASKAQRMLASAGLQVASPPKDASSHAMQQQQAPSPSPLDRFNPNNILGVSPNKRRARGGAGAALKAPVRFSLLRFLATDVEQQPSATPGGDTLSGGTEEAAVAPGDAVSDGAAEAVVTAGAVGGPAAAASPCASFGRGDLVEFSVVARKGQRQQNQRTGRVTLVAKGGVPCRRGKVLEVDTKGGMAHVELAPVAPVQDDKAAAEGATATATATPTANADTSTNADATSDANDIAKDSSNATDAIAKASASTTGTAAQAADGGEAAKETVADGAAAAAGGGERVFFLLKEMVGAAGPLRTGDEVDFLLPPPPPGGKPQKASAGNPSGGGRAVGTVRVQDLKSLAGTRQRLNLNLRDSQKGPQVRIAQGPDGAGFKAGHRASASFYAPSSSSSAILEGDEAASGDVEVAPSSSSSTTTPAGIATTSVDVAAEETVSQGEEQKASATKQAAEVAADGEGQ